MRAKAFCLGGQYDVLNAGSDIEQKSFRHVSIHKYQYSDRSFPKSECAFLNKRLRIQSPVFELLKKFVKKKNSQ